MAHAHAARRPAARAPGRPGLAPLAKNSKSDQVVWMQQHLASADPSVVVNGTFDAATDTALRTFQAAHGIAVSGTTDALTWQALLALPVKPVVW